MELTWVRREFAPTRMFGEAVVLDDMAYFHGGNYMYSYAVAEDEWTKLIRCE